VFAVSTRSRRRSLVALGAVLGVFALLIAAWGIDAATHADHVMRNVAIAGRPVGGLSTPDLQTEVTTLAHDQRDRVVLIETPNGRLETTAQDVGLDIDPEETLRAASDAGRDEAWPLRPFSWFASLFSDRSVQPVYRLDDAAMTAELDDLARANRVEPREPAVMVAEGRLVATPGEGGAGLSLDDVASALEHAATTSGDVTKPITLAVDPVPVPPRFSDTDAQRVASEGNELATQGLVVHVDGQSTAIAAGTLLSWMRAGPADDGNSLALTIDPTTIETDVTAAVGAVGVPPVELSWNVQPDGSVTYATGSNGTKCCSPDSPQRVVNALRSGTRDVTLDLTAATPLHDATWAKQMNIRQQVASFTTNHACCESRVQNIHRIADLIRGAVIAPGETFSVNEYVGQRTRAKGFVEAGVIYSGRFTTDVGGGVSQFGTTMFNAAFFGGLDFVEYQAHTIYISRYPYGREATLSYPSPDLKVTNTTPFGILIWPTYTDTSITVSLYSSPWVSGDQTGQQRQSAGRCTRVVTERTRTYLVDGRKEVDTVSALYQPGEGVLC
jgi:vancomycin resistance protein YoaR